MLDHLSIRGCSLNAAFQPLRTQFGPRFHFQLDLSKYQTITPPEIKCQRLHFQLCSVFFSVMGTDLLDPSHSGCCGQDILKENPPQTPPPPSPGNTSEKLEDEDLDKGILAISFNLLHPDMSDQLMGSSSISRICWFSGAVKS